MSDQKNDHWVDGAPPPAWSWPCQNLGPARRCQHDACKPVPVEGVNVPTGHAGGLTGDQVIRIHALAAAVESKPGADLSTQLQLAGWYANWIRGGGN